MTNILMVEDDKELANIIIRYLSSFGMSITNTTNGLDAISKLTSNEKYDLLILDLTLPDIDGLELIVKIRNITKIPIIISSARDDLLDKIMGLERGADDYLPKPYDPRELEARIKSILRRHTPSTEGNSDIFSLDIDNHTIKFKGEILDLTLAEFDILSLLIQRKNGVVSREDMIYDSFHIDDDSSLKNIDVMISRIRNKISTIDDKKYIHSVRGMGYTLKV
jgi:two-component system OmpR family response regulator